MKKYKMSLLFTLLFAVFLAGCGTKNVPAGDASESTTNSSASTDEANKNLSNEETTSKDQTPSLQKLTLVLDWTPNTNHTGIYVAMDKGYYAEEGIELEVQQPPEGGGEALTAAGKADFAISFQDSIAPAYAKKEKLPVTAVAAVLAHNTSGIISLKEKNIDSPKGLEGKKYATWDQPVEKAMLQNVVEKDGGDFSKVNLIPSTVTDVVSALQTDMDAVWVYEGWDLVAAKNANLDVNFWKFSDVNPVFDYYTPTIVANDNLLKENPEMVRAFLRATKKGYEYAAQHPEESADILLKAAPELDRTLVVESQKVLSTQYYDEGQPWGKIDADRWNRFYAWLWENQLIEQEIPENTGFTNEFLPEN